jgi:hypothetical protein
LLIGAALFTAWLTTEQNNLRHPQPGRARVLLSSQVLACLVLGLAISAIAANALSGVP